MQGEVNDEMGRSNKIRIKNCQFLCQLNSYCDLTENSFRRHVGQMTNLIWHKRKKKLKNSWLLKKKKKSFFKSHLSTVWVEQIQDCLIQQINDIIKDASLIIFLFCHPHPLDFVLRLVPSYYEMVTAASSIKPSNNNNQKQNFKRGGEVFSTSFWSEQNLPVSLRKPGLILIGQNNFTVLSSRPIVSKVGGTTINNKIYSLRLQIRAAPSWMQDSKR